MTNEKTAGGESPSKIAPGPRNIKALAAAAEKYSKRDISVSVAWERNPETGQPKIAAPHNAQSLHSMHMSATFGTASSAFTGEALTMLEWSTRQRGQAQGQEAQALNAGLALVNAINPQDELEAALALQMAGCHALSMDMLGRARHADSSEHLKLFGDMAVKLQRTFTAQVEALARMRGKGQQTVRVEHVTVQPGAQAIVGDVHHHAPGAPGVVTRTEELPHGSTTAAAIAQGSAALPCPDPQGNGVPIPSDAERAMPAPRRTVTRRAPRKSARLQARAMEP